MMAERIYPEPVPTGETQEFWDAARQGRFLLRRAKSTGRAHWYPRTLCPFGGGETEWFEASGQGEIYAFSVMRKAAPVYVMAYVTLAEGPTMMTNIVDCDPDRLRIGDKVELVFVTTPAGAALPMFRPVPCASQEPPA
jgi:uncharacterized OB-fold protein